MREVYANNTSGELGSEFPGSLMGESVFRTAKLEMPIESASWLPRVSVVPECQRVNSDSVPVIMWSSGGE